MLGRGCSFLSRSGLGQARMRLDRHLQRFMLEDCNDFLNQRIDGLVNASSLSPIKMADSYCALLRASCRHSLRKFSMPILSVAHRVAIHISYLFAV